MRLRPNEPGPKLKTGNRPEPTTIGGVRLNGLQNLTRIMSGLRNPTFRDEANMRVDYPQCDRAFSLVSTSGPAAPPAEDSEPAGTSPRLSELVECATFSRYRILRRLGRSRKGTVYLLPIIIL